MIYFHKNILKTPYQFFCHQFNDLEIFNLNKIKKQHREKNLNAINTLFWQKQTVSTLVEMSLSSHKHRLTIMNISKWISTVLAFALLHVNKAKKVGRKTKQKIIRIWNKRVREVKIAETKISVHACFEEFYTSPLFADLVLEN